MENQTGCGCKPQAGTRIKCCGGKDGSDKYYSDMLIILDFDGTIGDSQALIIGTMQQTMRELKLEVKTKEECARTIGLRLDEGFRQLYGVSHDEAMHCAGTYRRIFMEMKEKMVVKPFPHVIETIRRMAADRHIVAIASSRSRASLLEYVEEMHIGDCISCIVAANDVERVKPAPDMVLKIMEETGGKPENTLVVGDMIYDIEMGRNAGTRTCAVTYGNCTYDELSAADYIIDDFAALLDIISRN